MRTFAISEGRKIMPTHDKRFTLQQSLLLLLLMLHLSMENSSINNRKVIMKDKRQ